MRTRTAIKGEEHRRMPARHDEIYAFRPTPFHEGYLGFRSRAGFLAPGPSFRAFPFRSSRHSGCAFSSRAAVGIPGHSGGSTPESHRLPFTSDRLIHRSYSLPPTRALRHLAL